MSLPTTFPLDQLAITNQRKLEWFYRRYVEEFYPEYRFGHFLFAAYAAVPALLTPDLLYKLWQNFHQYQWAGKPQRIHRVAVSDILLSPLCREVGYELYEMEPSIRTAFLGWQRSLEKDPVWQERKIPWVQAVAGFLTEYHAKPNPARQRWGTAYEELQEWNALAFTQPEALQQKIWHKLQNSVAGQKETETLRVLDFWSKAGPQLGFALPAANQQQWEKNAAFAQAWKALLQHNTKAFIEAVKQDPAKVALLDDRPEGGIAVQMPAAVKAEIDSWAKETSEDTRDAGKATAIIVGINEYRHAELPSQQGCINDASEFQSYLVETAEYLGLPPMDNVLLLDGEATIGQVSDSLNKALATLQDGDFFVFFFAGNSANKLMTSSLEKDGTLFLYDSQPTKENWTGLRQEELENLLFAALREKTITCLLILDHPKSAGEPLTKGGPLLRRNAPEGLRGSLIILYGADTGELTYERFLGEHMRGVFPFALISVLKEKGPDTNFQQLIETTRLRMTQLVDRQTPQLEAFPSHMEHSKLFSHIQDKDTFGPDSVYFDNWRSSYIFTAGSRKGITPSLEFMATIVRLEDGRTLLVDEVFETYSTLRNFTGDGDIEKRYPATVLQTALPKIRIAFDPGIDTKMETRLRSVIQSYSIYYIDIRDKVEEAQYFIHSWQNNYFLSRQTSTKTLTSGSIKPLFNLEPDPFELIKQMEYIAQWSGVLEYQKPRTGLDRNDLLLEMELFDGRRSGALTDGKAEPTSIVQDPQGISLRDFPRDRSSRITKYSAPPGMNARSAFRLKLSHRGQTPLYIQALYLNSSYGIVPIGRSLELYPNDREKRLEHVGNNPDLFMIDFPIKYLDLGITEVYDYLKLLVSIKPINIGALEQESLQLDREVTRSTTYRQQTDKDSFTIGDTDWLAITIPIRIKYSETTATETSVPPFPMSNIGGEENIAKQPESAGSESLSAPEQMPEETFRPDVEAIKNLIAEGALKAALEQLLQYTKNTESENEVILLSGRLNSLERESLNGLISSDEYALSRNRITYALLQIVDRLDSPLPA